MLDGGTVVHEWYADSLGPDTLFLGASMTKSVLAHLVGRHRDRLGAEALCAVEQRRELEVAVAVRARQRRPAGGILADEVVDDLLAKLPLEVEDVMGNPDCRRHPPRVVQVVNRAAGAERPLAGRPSRHIVELHGQTDDVVALLDEQRRRHR